MSVKVIITRNDGTKEQHSFRGWLEYAAWLEKEHGGYKAASASEIRPEKIRQGRDQ